MQSRKVSLGLAVAAVLVAAGLFVVLRDDGEDGDDGAPPVAQTTAAEEPPGEPEGEPTGEPSGGAQQNDADGGDNEPSVPTINVRGGEPVGGVAELDFKGGQRVEFAVRSDTDDEIHVHGYDLNRDVEAGERTRVSFPAELEGVFEVELHGAAVEIARISINP